MSDSSAPIHVFEGMVHPDRKAMFREDAPPKSMIKEGRKEAILACTKCGKMGDEERVVKKCAGCKLAYYCSQEVRANESIVTCYFGPTRTFSDCRSFKRPIHKPNCSSELGEGIQPLIKSVTGNPMISHYIQVCLALEFSLHRIPASKRRAASRKPLSVHIDVGIEPTMIADLMSLYTYPDEWDKDDMEGMLQFHHLSTPDSWVPPRQLSPKDLVIWNQARADADEDGEEDCAVVLVQFVNNFRQCITCLFVVGDDALGQARRNKPFTVGSAITGKTTDKPLSVPTCFEYLNTHIRADKKNHLLLRAPMRPSDKELIRDAGRQNDGHAPRMLRLKMSREGVYVSHPISVVRDSAADREEAFGHRRRPAANANGDPLPESRQIEAAPQEEGGEGQAQPEPPKMNRAERRRQQQEQKRAEKRRK